MIVGVVAVVASLLAILEADSHRRNAIAGARGSRYSVDIFAGTAASSPFFTFRLSSLQDATGLALEASERALAAFRQPAAVRTPELVRARAEQAASKRLTAVVDAMTAPPTAADGVDAVTRAAVAATPAELAELTRRQNEQVDRAERYARRETRAILGLSLSATAAALLGLGGLIGATRPGRLLVGVALAATLAAIAAGASVL